MESLSILIMNWRDIRNPDAGGAEVFTHEVARRWVSWGHVVTVLTSEHEGLPKEELVDGVRIIRDGGRLTVYRSARRTYARRFRNDVDAVIDEINTRPFLTPRYVNDGTALFALIYQLAREFWFYETPFPVNMLGRYVLEDHWLAQYLDLPTFTISRSTEKDLLELGFRDVTVVPAGVSVPPLDDIPEKEPTPTLIYVSRLKRAKLPHHALRAFILIRRRLPSARLWVVGDGYLRDELQRRSPEGVTFFGKVAEAEKFELLARAHVLLNPAVREGWGLTVLEANAVGTPAVGYDVPGLRDSIRNQETGLLVPFADVHRLASCAVRLIENEVLRRTLAKNGLRWARQFRWDQTAEQLLTGVQSKMTS